MHIGVTARIKGAGSEIPIQRLSWSVGEGRSEFLARGSVVAESALVDLAVAIESCRIEDARERQAGITSWLVPLLFHVCGARTMTGLAADSRSKAGPYVDVCLGVV